MEPPHQGLNKEASPMHFPQHSVSTHTSAASTGPRNSVRRSPFWLASVLAASLSLSSVAMAQVPAGAYTPDVGQAGKDVVWVPTPEALVEKMLEIAKATKNDRLLDLGSGDGRTVIAAAKKGLTAQGIEYNPDMAELARHNARAAGVQDKATFVTADLFETDLNKSKATIITMFLLPTINEKLRPQILNLEPGTRIVSNSFGMGEWQPDARETVSDKCSSYCTALLWIVPAKVDGAWLVDGQRLSLTQTFQTATGKLGSAAISDAKLDGKKLTFTANGVRYEGVVEGNSIKGTKQGGGNWSAKKTT